MENNVKETNEGAEVRHARRERKRTFKIQLGNFRAEIGRDVAWFWDIRLWSPILVVLLVAALMSGRKPAAEVTIPEEIPAPTQEVEMEIEPAAPVETQPVLRDAEAEMLARLADTVGAGRTDRVKKVIMWIAINRSEDRANGFGKSLEEEIARPNQWQFYDESASYGEGTYLLALDVLKVVRTNDLRPVEKDMLWLVLNDDGSVSIRNSFNMNNKTTQKTIK